MTASAPSTNRPLRMKVWYLSIAVLAALTIAGLAILVGSGWASDISALGAMALLLFFVVSVTSALATTEIIPWNSLSWSLLHEPRILGVISAILISSFGTVGGFLDLLQDKGGTATAMIEINSMLGRIDENVEAARTTSEEIKVGLENKGIIAGQATNVEKAINGVWGQRDCLNTYLFELSPAGHPERTLTIKSIISAAGMEPFDGEYAFKSVHEQISNDGFTRSILSTEEIKGFDPGFAVDFTLVRSGSFEKLIWASKSSELNAPELVRCQE